jgi:hypothetical protein
MGSDPVAVVANSVHCHDQSLGLGIYDSDTTWRPDWNVAVLRLAVSTYDVVYVEERSLRVMAVRLQKVGVNITCQTLRWSVRTNELVTSDTTQHVYDKEMFVIAFDSSTWTITIP